MTTQTTPLPGTCRWCGLLHPAAGRLCPYVKAFEFAEDGERVTRVEFLTPADYPAMKNPDPAAAGEGSAESYPKLGPKGVKDVPQS